MNQDLLEQIVLHIFSQFAIIPSDFVNAEKTKSLRDKEYQLNDKLDFELENGYVVQNRIWGCQLKVGAQLMSVVLGNCTLEKNEPEFALIFSCQDAPTYGLYLDPGHSVIGYSMNGKDWLESTTYLQATFLAAMEQVRELGMKWEKPSNEKDLISTLKTFIHFKNSIDEANDEGQEG
jgi:hypothetical protein